MLLEKEQRIDGLKSFMRLHLNASDDVHRSPGRRVNGIIFISFFWCYISFYISFYKKLVLISSSNDSIGAPEKRVEWKRISCNQYSPKGSQIGGGERAEKYGLLDSQELALNGTGKGSGRTNVEKREQQQQQPHPLQHQESPPKHVAWEDREIENEKEKDKEKEKESEKEEETEEKAESDKEKNKESEKEEEKEKEKEKEVDSDKEKGTIQGEKSSPSQQRPAPPKRVPKGKVQIAPTTPDQSDKKPEYGKEKARKSKANLTKSATPRPLLAMRSMGELHVHHHPPLPPAHTHTHIQITTDGQEKNIFVKAVVG